MHFPFAISDLATLRALLAGDDARDRAFVDGLLRMRWARCQEPSERAELSGLHAELRAAALRGHAPLRAQIAAGALRGAALRRRFDQVPLLERDHFVEEVLGIAYPALEEPSLPRELVAYMPSGYDEIVHAFELTALKEGDRFLDLGSGMGKAILLAELLTGATSAGVELDRTLVTLADEARSSLGLRGARTTQADAREHTLEDAEVVFMYLPFTGGALETVLKRLEQVRPNAPAAGRRYLCAGALDLRRHPALVPVGSARSWLNVYVWQ